MIEETARLATGVDGVVLRYYFKSESDDVLLFLKKRF